MAASLLVTARSAVLLADGDRHLATSLAFRTPVSNGAGVTEQDLGAGFLLVQADVTGVGWSVWDVAWRADPARIAAELRGAAETGGGVQGEGGDIIAIGNEGADGIDCPDATPLAVHWLRGLPRPPRPQPELPDFPRLGPIGIAELSERAELTLLPGERFPDRDGVLLVVPAGAHIGAGSMGGLVLSPGDLGLGAGTSVRGLVLVAGNLLLEEGAMIRGAVRVGGEVRFMGGGSVIGCREIVRENLASLPELDAPFSLSGGGLLGRH